MLDGWNKCRDEWTRAAVMVKFVNGGQATGGREVSGEGGEEKQMRCDEKG